MKLFFKRDENGDITVRMQKGTVYDDFDYIEMLRQLMTDNRIEEPSFENIEDEEKVKIMDLLNKISEAVKEGMGGVKATE